MIVWKKVAWSGLVSFWVSRQFGHEKEILDMMRKFNDNQVQLRNKGQMVSCRCERELKKPECTINLNG